MASENMERTIPCYILKRGRSQRAYRNLLIVNASRSNLRLNFVLDNFQLDSKLDLFVAH